MCYLLHRGGFSKIITHEGSREEFERKAGSRRSRREPRISTGTSVEFIHSSSTSPETRVGQGLPTAPPICTEHEDTDVRGKARGPERRTVLPWRARTAPVVDAYNPTGIPGSAATLGKYYPSNYEASDAADSSLQSPGAVLESAASPPGSAQEHQLMQYKRDLISQTLQTARETLGRTMQRQASVKTVDRVLDEGSRKSIASGVALLRRYKPSSPRITPLLSPGPVTPMALDESEGRDYLSVKDVRPR
ncbi:hypothetical protein GE09DRAFT_196376 [Coniochaeta sp. 2T2.1]|nr:hypothetical protein GE09DRAFT_196376 [Coniochaeta sp. 2T2.1]